MGKEPEPETPHPKQPEEIQGEDKVSGKDENQRRFEAFGDCV